MKISRQNITTFIIKFAPSPFYENKIKISIVKIAFLLISFYSNEIKKNPIANSKKALIIQY